jgi:hypothetical protein
MSTSRVLGPLVLLLMILSAAAPGGAVERPFEVAVTMAPQASFSQVGGYDLGVTTGLGLGWHFTRVWSSEIRALRSNGDQIDLASVQLGVRRFFDLGGDWWPFVHGGLYRERTETEEVVFCLQAPCPPRRLRETNEGVFAGAGVDWRFSDRAALRIDGLVMAADTERYGTETWQSAGVGLAFRF